MPHSTSPPLPCRRRSLLLSARRQCLPQSRALRGGGAEWRVEVGRERQRDRLQAEQERRAVRARAAQRRVALGQTLAFQAGPSIVGTPVKSLAKSAMGLDEEDEEATGAGSSLRRSEDWAALLVCAP